jgi:lysophospholipase L1-like esterase
VGLNAAAQVSPAEILANLLAAFSLLLLVSLFFPTNGVYVSPRVTLAFPSLQKIFDVEDSYPGAISMDCSDRGFFLAEPQQQGRNSRSVLPLNCSIDDVRALPIQPIEYPRDYEDALNGIMFDLASLRIPNNRKLVRILHYGDSQLEADRMTLYLRGELQKEFGGGGIGYVALNPQIPINPTVKISLSPEWSSSTPAVKHKGGEPLRVGHLLSNVSISSKQDKNAWIKIDRRQLRAYPQLKFSRIKLLVNNRVAPIFFEAKTPTQTLHSCVLQPGKGMQLLNVNMRNSPENVTLYFSGSGCPEVYGVGLDYVSGVAVDNIPLRSSSGVDFVKADAATLQRGFDLVGAKLIILQFGTNVVPKIMNSYSYYEEQLYEQLILLKRLQPNVNILVVGVADMARRVDGVMASYPNIEKIRDAQKRAAFRAGCAFWDTYKAMGGKNSIVSWAHAQPSLASKDFCHFSATGATLLAELLYRSIRQEFNIYAAMHKNWLPKPGGVNKTKKQ